MVFHIFFFKQKTAYEMRISDWSSDVCSSDLLPLIVEVETLAQLEEALAEGCERILIDDFDAETRREAVRIAAGEPFNRAIPLEVSGGVDLPGLRAIAEDGVDCISIGALDRQSVGEGKRVAGRVEIGGGRILKKKN